MMIVLAFATPGLRAQTLDPLDIDGRTFQGVRIPVAPTSADLTLRARRAHVWIEEPPSAGLPGAGRANRLLLEEDVEITIGVYSFRAAAAVVWIERLADDPDGARQVFIFFDRVGTPDADAAISVNADRLPVQGVISGDVRLNADVSGTTRPEHPLVLQGERTLATYLRGIVGGEEWRDQARRLVGGSGGAELPGLDRPFAAELDPPPPDPRNTEALLDRVLPVESPDPIFASSGLIAFSAGNATLVAGDNENTLVITDGVVVEYWDRASQRTLQISAERGVVFLEPGPLERLDEFDAEDVMGIYLEGAVQASDGQYTLRGPRVYYDVRANRATVIDAVFWTYDDRRRMPLYVRAEAIRQQSADQFRAEHARLANTAFFRPHLSLGATSITVTRRERDSGGRSTIVDARNITLRAGRFPFFYLPIVKGDPEDIPIREVSIDVDDGGGTSLKTGWDLLAILGIESPSGVTARLLLDWYSKRNFGLGTEWIWRRERMKGAFFAYLLPSDDGDDVTATGARVTNDGRTRGIVLIEQLWSLAPFWTLLAEGSFISDETFIDGLFDDLAETRREFANRLLLRRTKDNTQLWAQTKGSLNDFTPNEYILQSQGYTVDKLPEIGYARIGDDLIADAPGLLSYTGEASYALLGLNFNDPIANEFGFDTNGRSRAAFGIDADQSIADRLSAEGFREYDVNRFDTRHEISSRLDAGPVRVRPYAVGRVTMYDQDFQEFSPNETEPTRLWGSLGVEASTTLTSVDDSARSRALDIHRMRHIVVPSLSVSVSDATLGSENLPVYDDEVESLLEGTVTRFAIDQTWQTKRGGPGRWTDVNVFTLDAEIVFSSDDTDAQSPNLRYFSFRPELSNPGDHLAVEGTWLVSDALGLTASTVQDLERGRQIRSSLGATIDHTPSFASFAELRHLETQDSTDVVAGSTYAVGDKYTLSGITSYNTDQNDFQHLTIEARREFPNAILGFGIRFNNITSETSFGFSVQPVGVRPSEGLRLRGIGATRSGQRSSALGG